MSSVTSIAILNGYTVRPIDKLLELGFKQVDSYSGGSKVLGGDVFLGAFNYLKSEAKLMAEIKAAGWHKQDPEDPYSEEDDKPILLILREHESNWSLWVPNDE